MSDSLIGELRKSVSAAETLGSELANTVYDFGKDREFLTGAASGALATGAAAAIVTIGRKWFAPAMVVTRAARALTAAEAQSAAALAAKAAERIEYLYQTIEPRLGVHLTDPNVVLTLAGARGQTEFPLLNPRVGDKRAFAALSNAADKFGIRFTTKEITMRSNGQPALSVNIESLEGYERTTAQTALPGVLLENYYKSAQHQAMRADSQFIHYRFAKD